MLSILWILLYLARKDLRRKMLWLSITLGFLGPIGEVWFLRDYWQPQIFFGRSIGLEDYLFMFFITGIACVLHQVVFNFKISPRITKSAHNPAVVISSIIIGSIVLANILVFVFKMNSMYAGIVTMISIAVTIVFVRRDFVVDCLLGGLLTSAVMFIGYMTILSIYPELIHRWWLIKNLSGVMIRGIPMEELLWGFAFGAMMGPLYEFIFGHSIEKRGPKEQRAFLKTQT